MIRREIEDVDWLITQDDHGVLAGVCAEHLGNDQFARAEPFGSVVSGVRMHDAGWPLHDDRPTIDGDGRPLNVFDRPWPIALKVWGASVERAVSADAYGGLLASIHAMRITQGLADRDTPEGKAAIARFVTEQERLQQRLRSQLSLETAAPLEAGLARIGTSAREDQLIYNFHWLQACDLFSLAVLNTTLPQLETRPVQRAPGGERFTLRLDRPEEMVLTVEPWPFDTAAFSWEVPARRLARRRYGSDAELAEAYRGAEKASLRVEMRRG